MIVPRHMIFPGKWLCWSPGSCLQLWGPTENVEIHPSDFWENMKIWAAKNIQVVNIQVLELGNRQMYDPAQLYIGRYIALLCCPKQRQRQKRQTHMKSSTALLYVRDKDACPRCLVASLYDHDAQALTWGDLHFYQEHNLNCRHQHQTYQSHGQRSRG